MKNQRTPWVKSGLSPLVAKMFVKSGGQMGEHTYEPCSEGSLYSKPPLFVQVCSLKELLTNCSNSLNHFLITYASTPEFLSNFFFPLQGHLATTPKVPNTDINIRKEPRSSAETLQFILETCSSFLTAWLRLQFSFSLRQAPYADCYTEMTLNPQACNREAIFKFDC